MIGPARSAIALACVLTATSASWAQDALAVARASYAAARYDHALGVLQSADVPTAADAEASRLQALCLLALGRQGEAERAIAHALELQPSVPPPRDVSPRVLNVFLAVRSRVLPDLAVARYESGKAAFERRDFAVAIAAFEDGLPLLEALALEGNREMEARRVLATDFLTLSRRLQPPRVEERPTLDAAAPGASMAVPAARAVSAPLQTPPIIVRQDLPPWPYALGKPYAAFRGAIDVSIDEAGVVVAATIVTSVHPLYDQELVRAARKWRYEPARRAGRPVATTKRVEIVLGDR